MGGGGHVNGEWQNVIHSIHALFICRCQFLCNILFSAKSSLRNCLDTQLLRHHHLIVPEDFSSEEVTPSKAPKGQFPG